MSDSIAVVIVDCRPELCCLGSDNPEAIDHRIHNLKLEEKHRNNYRSCTSVTITGKGRDRKCMHGYKIRLLESREKGETVPVLYFVLN